MIHPAKPMQVKVVRNGREINKGNCIRANKHISTFEVTVRTDNPVSTEDIRKAVEKAMEVTGVKFILKITIAA